MAELLLFTCPNWKTICVPVFFISVCFCRILGWVLGLHTGIGGQVGETRRNQEGKEEGIRIEQGKKLPRMWFQIKLS